MNAYQIEAGTAQHSGDRPRQTDRVALLTAAGAPGHVLAVLSDGLGNATGADQALLTAQQLFSGYRAGDSARPARLHALFDEIVHEAHQLLAMNPYAGAPQATLALLALTPQGQALWAHVGDSRIYRLRAGQCLQRSGDAGYIRHLIEHDGLAPEAAQRHRAARPLHNVLGNPLRAPYAGHGGCEDVQAGDAFLLCSDGLWQYFTDTELAAVAARHPPRQAAERLLAKAGERAHGKGDNRSMAMLRLVPRA